MRRELTFSFNLGCKPVAFTVNLSNNNGQWTTEIGVQSLLLDYSNEIVANAFDLFWKLPLILNIINQNI